MDIQARKSPLADMHERIQGKMQKLLLIRRMAEMQVKYPVLLSAAKGITFKYATLEDVIDVVRPIMNNTALQLALKLKIRSSL